MNLSKLQNQELHLNLKSLVSRKRETRSEILLFICEIDRRKLYLDFGCASLFEYLTKEMGYSSGSAQRRIDACRLSYEVPTVIQDLESGVLSLEQVGLVQRSIRQARRQSYQARSESNQTSLAELTMAESSSLSFNSDQTDVTNPVVTIQTNKSSNVHAVHDQRNSITANAKAQLLASLKEKSFSESQAIVSKTLDIKIKSKQQITNQADGSIRLEVTFTKDQWEKLNRMRELLSHSLPTGSWDDVFEHVADRVIKSKTSIRNSKQQLSEIRSEEQPVQAVQKKLTDSRSKAVKPFKPADTSKDLSFYQNRKLLLKQHSCCQYKDKHTGKTCTSKWQLQVDHIQPRWAGGVDDISNLRVLCGVHNRATYRVQAGIRLA